MDPDSLAANSNCVLDSHELSPFPICAIVADIQNVCTILLTGHLRVSSEPIHLSPPRCHRRCNVAATFSRSRVGCRSAAKKWTIERIRAGTQAAMASGLLPHRQTGWDLRKSARVVAWAAAAAMAIGNGRSSACGRRSFPSTAPETSRAGWGRPAQAGIRCDCKGGRTGSRRSPDLDFWRIDRPESGTCFGVEHWQATAEQRERQSSRTRYCGQPLSVLRAIRKECPSRLASRTSMTGRQQSRTMIGVSMKAFSQ